MVTRKQFEETIKTWYHNTYENLVKCMVKGEALIPLMGPEDQEYARGIIKMIRDTKEQCDETRARIRARYQK